MILVLLLALALAVQNTCPFGLAAKTGFVSPQMPDCPCAKKAAQKTAAGQNAEHVVSNSGHLFVFIGQGRMVVLPPQVSQRSCAACPAGFYRNISLNPPEKPPRLS
ncbi:MAG: hypothetical protein A2077_05035 [Nitrospirae bacterium GWC2_46_6]|nr:MAG: hypothetical protein A2Z82_12220 [Nitrospirae bacterium GWA2_46_11]OGW22638.1 MAG: hypothetical protein A2077_05035 [Nitrospirae bacterium GWC2_46_6]OGW23011.1 MAG: hypothetical protein A2X55_12620 [Nitrospirae bacterium GWB2_47_37]HAK88353.1 hypothetical protein [Nitrospiraceae bacterium]HCL81963.1 hypothetical protein [Nitrospiraceae bacterium]